MNNFVELLEKYDFYKLWDETVLLYNQTDWIM